MDVRWAKLLAYLDYRIEATTTDLLSYPDTVTEAKLSTLTGVRERVLRIIEG